MLISGYWVSRESAKGGAELRDVGGILCPRRKNPTQVFPT